MTVISTLVLHPYVDADINEFFALAKKALDGVKAVPGVDSVMFSAITIGGAATNSFAFTTTVADWETFGKVQGTVNSAPEFIQLLMESGKLSTWETYVGQEVDFSLLP